MFSVLCNRMCNLLGLAFFNHSKLPLQSIQVVQERYWDDNTQGSGILRGRRRRRSCCGAAGTDLTSIHEDVRSVPGLLSGLMIWHCCELWCRLQLRLRSWVAVAVAMASSCGSDATSSLETSICLRCGPKKKKKKRRRGEKRREEEAGVTMEDFHLRFDVSSSWNLAAECLWF